MWSPQNIQNPGASLAARPTYRCKPWRLVCWLPNSPSGALVFCGCRVENLLTRLPTCLSRMDRFYLTGLDGCGLHGRVKVYVKSRATDQHVRAAIRTTTVAIQGANPGTGLAPPAFHGSTAWLIEAMLPQS